MQILDSTSEEVFQLAIRRFWETFPSVWDKIRGNVRSIAVRHYGITVEQFHILRHIRKGCCSVSELATVKQISRPAISQSVEILVEKGWINRTQNKKDRRYVQLELTPNGNDQLNFIFEENRLWMLKKMAGLKPQEIDCILQSMETLKIIFDQELD